MSELIERSCEGLPARGDRTLAPDERVALRAQADEVLRRRRWAAFFSRAVLLIAGVCALAFAVTAEPGTEAELRVGVGMFAFAAASALGALAYLALFARGPGERLVFGLASAAAVVLVGGGPWLPAGVTGVLFSAVAIAGVFALPAWILRRRDSRRSEPAFAALPADVAAGEILVFGDNEHPAVEVLPRSRLRWLGAPTPEHAWLPVVIHELARAPERRHEHPLTRADVELVAADEQHRYRRRALAPTELDELRRVHRHLRRRLPAELFVTFILARSLAALVAVGWALVDDRPIRGAIDAGPVWIAVGAIVTGRAWIRGRALRALARDLARGEVLCARLRAESPLTAEVVAEYLPVSGLTWTEAREPADWRRPPS